MKNAYLSRVPPNHTTLHKQHNTKGPKVPKVPKHLNRRPIYPKPQTDDDNPAGPLGCMGDWETSNPVISTISLLEGLIFPEIKEKISIFKRDFFLNYRRNGYRAN